MSEIVQVVGRWARLANGDLVTPIRSFWEYRFDSAAFARDIAAFQRDPAAALKRGVVQRVETRRTPDITGAATESTSKPPLTEAARPCKPTKER